MTIAAEIGPDAEVIVPPQLMDAVTIGVEPSEDNTETETAPPVEKTALLAGEVIVSSATTLIENDDHWTYTGVVLHVTLAVQGPAKVVGTAMFPDAEFPLTAIVPVLLVEPETQDKVIRKLLATN